MRGPYTQLYIHCIWATWDRLPLIEATIEHRLYAAIAAKCRAIKCTPIAINGTADHIHLLVELATSVSVATLVKEVKGSSSHLVTHEIKPGEFFKWQGAYSAFTIAKSDVDRVKTYVERQKAHHAEGRLRGEWEQCHEPDATETPSGPPGRAGGLGPA